MTPRTIVHIGMAGAPDVGIASWLQEQDTVFTTNNRRDFLKLFGRLPIHNGLIIIVPAVGKPAQRVLFERALDIVETLDHTINRVIEVAEDGSVEVRNWPAPG